MAFKIYFLRVSMVTAIVGSGLLSLATVHADTIAIIGTGNVAHVLGPGFAGLGHEIVYGSREPQRPDVQELVQQTAVNASATTPAEAVRDADIVVLAVPGPAVPQVVDSLGDLAGKIIIDPTNPTTTDDDGVRTSAVATSNGEIIQEMAPDAFVVKAFNTMGTPTMDNPELFDVPIAVPLLGDNDEAKARVAALVSGIGLQPVDVGPIRFSRTVEGMLLLLIYAGTHGNPVNFSFAPPAPR